MSNEEYIAIIQKHNRMVANVKDTWEKTVQWIKDSGESTLALEADIKTTLNAAGMALLWKKHAKIAVVNLEVFFNTPDIKLKDNRLLYVPEVETFSDDTVVFMRNNGHKGIKQSRKLKGTVGLLIKDPTSWNYTNITFKIGIDVLSHYLYLLSDEVLQDTFINIKKTNDKIYFDLGYKDESRKSVCLHGDIIEMALKKRDVDTLIISRGDSNTFSKLRMLGYDIITIDSSNSTKIYNISGQSIKLGNQVVHYNLGWDVKSVETKKLIYNYIGFGSIYLAYRGTELRIIINSKYQTELLRTYSPMLYMVSKIPKLTKITDLKLHRYTSFSQIFSHINKPFSLDLGEINSDSISDMTSAFEASKFTNLILPKRGVYRDIGDLTYMFQNTICEAPLDIRYLKIPRNAVVYQMFEGLQTPALITNMAVSKEFLKQQEFKGKHIRQPR